MKQLLSNIRAWKNRIFPDWLWDIMVGAILGCIGLLGLLIGASWLVLAAPAAFTAWNQWYNRLFEWKDAVWRMAVPVFIFLIMIFLKAG